METPTTNCEKYHFLEAYHMKSLYEFSMKSLSKHKVEPLNANLPHLFSFTATKSRGPSRHPFPSRLS